MIQLDIDGINAVVETSRTALRDLKDYYEEKNDKMRDIESAIDSLRSAVDDLEDAVNSIEDLQQAVNKVDDAKNEVEEHLSD